MPFVFGTFGVLFIVAGVRGKTSNLFSLIKSDFTGTPNYFEWSVAIFLVGAFGYVKQLSTISRLFMLIVLAGLLYKNSGVFGELQAQETQQPIQTPNTTPTTQPTQPIQGAPGSFPAIPSLKTLLPSLGGVA